jgi:branched-chain amino acid aminotransferase
MKIYRGYDGKLRLFRPDKNCERLVLSSTRVALLPFDLRELEKLIKAFMKLDGLRKFPRSLEALLSFVRIISDLWTIINAI